MESIQITLARALKVWWSYAWRTFALMIPIMLLVQLPLMLFIMKQMRAQIGQPPQPSAFLGLGFFVVWLLLVTLYVAAQTFAMRWMLKTQWSDFRLVAVQPAGNEAQRTS